MGSHRQELQKSTKMTIFVDFLRSTDLDSEIENVVGIFNRLFWGLGGCGNRVVAVTSRNEFDPEKSISDAGCNRLPRIGSRISLIFTTETSCCLPRKISQFSIKRDLFSSSLFSLQKYRFFSANSMMFQIEKKLRSSYRFSATAPEMRFRDSESRRFVTPTTLIPHRNP